MVQTANDITHKLTATFLALILVVGMLPTATLAADSDLSDWYFLFAFFKNVDADCDDGKGTTTHTKNTMSQAEIDLVMDRIQSFDEYMNNTGLMRAHVDIIEIDTVVTELQTSNYGSYLSAEQAAPSLERAGVDLDRYDHVSCYISLNVATVYGGLTASEFENGTGYACHNLRNIEFARKDQNPAFPGSGCTHEFLHFMERLSKKWGVEFDLHAIREKFYTPADDGFRGCYIDILLNQVEGDGETGTGVSPAAWQYPPHVLRTVQELTIPEGVTSIGYAAFAYCSNLESVSIPEGVTSIGDFAFYDCRSLESVSIPDSVTSIGNVVFAYCGNLESVSIPEGVTSIGTSVFRECENLCAVTIPSSVISIGYAAFHACNSLRAVYYGGSREQWDRIFIDDEYNTALYSAILYPGRAAPEKNTITVHADLAGDGGIQYEIVSAFSEAKKAYIVAVLYDGSGKLRETEVRQITLPGWQGSQGTLRIRPAGEESVAVFLLDQSDYAPLCEKILL